MRVQVDRGVQVKDSWKRGWILVRIGLVKGTRITEDAIIVVVIK